MTTTYTVHNPQCYTYKGITCKQNPLTDDWLVVLSTRFGSYYCATKTECRKLIDEAIRREVKP